MPLSEQSVIVQPEANSVAASDSIESTETSPKIPVPEERQLHEVATIYDATLAQMIHGKDRASFPNGWTPAEIYAGKRIAFQEAIKGGNVDFTKLDTVDGGKGQRPGELFLRMDGNNFVVPAQGEKGVLRVEFVQLIQTDEKGIKTVTVLLEGGIKKTISADTFINALDAANAEKVLQHVGESKPSLKKICETHLARARGESPPSPTDKERIAAGLSVGAISAESAEKFLSQADLDPALKNQLEAALIGKAVLSAEELGAVLYATSNIDILSDKIAQNQRDIIQQINALDQSIANESDRDIQYQLKMKKSQLVLQKSLIDQQLREINNLQKLLPQKAEGYVQLVRKAQASGGTAKLELAMQSGKPEEVLRGLVSQELDKLRIDAEKDVEKRKMLRQLETVAKMGGTVALLAVFMAIMNGAKGQ